MFHQPVMVKQIGDLLVSPKMRTLLDLTCGGGGHIKYLSEIVSEKVTFIGIDRDPEAVAECRNNLGSAPQKIEIVNSTFNRFDEVLLELEVNQVDAVLMDLGGSSHQFDSAERGFSHRLDGPLDMRMGTDSQLTADTIINTYSRKQLTDIFKNFGEEKRAGAVAAAIVKSREKQEIKTTQRLVEVIKPVLSPRYLRTSLSRVFQALRIEINCELDQLRETLPKIMNVLSSGGRLAVISYHSLEDRIVKQFFALQVKDCICPSGLPVCACDHKPAGKLVNRRVIRPEAEEIEQNSRAQSAKLRVIEKII
jgi:16S rRNA (cytosine1402-N4)-methyltransferase